MLTKERSFWFGEYNTWKHWNCILTQKDITPPEPKTNYVELDGMSGSLDLSEALSGEVTYHDRVITATFWTCTGNYQDRARLLREIMCILCGRRMRIIEPDSYNGFYYGRVRVTSITNTQAYAEFSIEALCDPWLYDEFQRIEYRIALEDGTNEWAYYNWGVKTVCPEIEVEGNVILTCNGITTEATTGRYKITTFKLFPGENTILVSGQGTVTLTVQEATL